MSQEICGLKGLKVAGLLVVGAMSLSGVMWLIHPSSGNSRLVGSTWSWI